MVSHKIRKRKQTFQSRFVASRPSGAPRVRQSPGGQQTKKNIVNSDIQPPRQLKLSFLFYNGFYLRLFLNGTPIPSDQQPGACTKPQPNCTSRPGSPRSHSPPSVAGSMAILSKMQHLSPSIRRWSDGQSHVCRSQQR